MNIQELQSTIDVLYQNPKILSVDIFRTELNTPAYASIVYQDRKKDKHYILVDVPDLHLLVDPFSLTTIAGKYKYVRLKDCYLHQAILPVTEGYVVHHISSGFTTDNRRCSLQVLPYDVHLLFHRRQTPRKSTTTHSKETVKICD